MRIGKQMRSILKVFNKTAEPLTQTEVILKLIKKTKDAQNPRNSRQGLVLASSLTGGYLSGESAASWTKIKGKYHPIAYADLLYASYSRSFKLLKRNGLIAYTHKKRFHHRYAKAYTITEKGKKFAPDVAKTDRPPSRRQSQRRT
jgi:predicted transcriptional regulator